MTFSKIHVLFLAILVIAIIGVGLWRFTKTDIPATVSTSMPAMSTSSAPTATSTSSVPASPKHTLVLPSISSQDTITSWNFAGPFKDGGVREADTRQKIADLKSKLGGTGDYNLYVSLAQEYSYLGDGKSAYDALSRAIALDTNETTGVAWHNLGVLMEQLGAYNTARIAHERAVKIQWNISAFQISRVELMVYHFPKDTAGVEKAFKDAEALLGANDPTLLDLRQKWKTLVQ